MKANQRLESRGHSWSSYLAAALFVAWGVSIVLPYICEPSIGLIRRSHLEAGRQIFLLLGLALGSGRYMAYVLPAALMFFVIFQDTYMSPGFWRDVANHMWSNALIFWGISLCAGLVLGVQYRKAMLRIKRK